MRFRYFYARAVSSFALADNTAMKGFLFFLVALLISTTSLMYGNRRQNNENGTFISTTPYREMKLYSPLDLYLMGMIDKSGIPSILLIENSSIDPARLPEAGVTISGTARTDR